MWQFCCLDPLLVRSTISVGYLNSIKTEPCHYLSPKQLSTFATVVCLPECQRLKKLPRSVSKLGALESLLLNGSAMAAMSDFWVKGLSSLQDLTLRRVVINALPDAINQLISLERLSVQLNHSIELPGGISRLTALREFFLNCPAVTRPKKGKKKGKVVALPGGIKGLVSLERFELRVPSLAAIPEGVSGMRSLRFLKLKCPALVALPKGIGRLSALLVLILEDCRSLRLLPDTIGGLTSLEALEMEGCAEVQVSIFFFARHTVAFLELQ